MTSLLSARSGDKRNQKGTYILRRPIICICNDVNAASLAKLRLHAYQVRMLRPADIHVVKRLREICELEGLKAESRALTTLAGVSKGDLRGCLNTLQVPLLEIEFGWRMFTRTCSLLKLATRR